MLLLEEYRKCIQKRWTWGMLLGLLILSYCMERIPVTKKHEFSEEIYRAYVEEIHIAGAYSNQKEVFLREEQIRYLDIISQYDEIERQYRFEEITQNDYMRYIDQFREAKAKLPVVDYLVEKCDYYQTFSSEDKVFFYELDWENFFMRMGFDYIPCCMLLLCVLPVFSIEYASGSVPLVLTSKYGRKHLYFAKLVLGVVMTFSFCAAYYGIRFGLFWQEIKGAFSEQNAVNLLGKAHLSDSMIGVYWKEAFLRCVLFSYLSIVVCVGAIATRNTTMAMMLGFLLLFIPVLLSGYLPTNTYYMLSSIRLMGLRTPDENGIVFYCILAIKGLLIIDFGKDMWTKA